MEEMHHVTSVLNEREPRRASLFPVTGKGLKTQPLHRESLAGLWNFAFLGGLDPEQIDISTLICTEKMPVPSAFDALPDYAGKRGLALYQRTLQIPPNSRARLHFEAVSMWCRIYIDGQLLREHACGYSPFHVDVPFSSSKERTLSVLVDNRFDFERTPMHEEYFDFYQYGGIIRDCTLEVRPRTGVFLNSIRVTPLDGYKSGEVEVRLSFEGDSLPGQFARYHFDTETDQSVPQPLLEEGRVTFRAAVPKPQLWSPDSPHLHTITVSLHLESGDKIQEMTETFGLRKIEAKEGAIYLNGSVIRLKGYNRHEWHPNYGPCTPTLQMSQDLQWLRALGCNFVRGSHYPQDKRFLDLCDQLGFLVWEENLGWGQREKTFQSAKFRADHAESLKAMLDFSYNHPSIIIRGFLNEAGTDQPYVRPIIEESVSLIRQLDPSRLVSYATMFPLTDTCYDLVDVISLNLYPGWYNCEGTSDPLSLIEPFMWEQIEKIDQAGWRHKPILISEIGAEAIYGWHDLHDDFFTEEYQAQYLRQSCEAALGNHRCSGIALWHFSDVRTYGGGWSLKRPRTFNNKGTFDEYRRPKLAYHAVRQVFRAAAK